MSHDTLITRIRAEFLEMPGLQLTLAQAQRFCGIEQTSCKSVFDALVAEKFLYLKSNGAYARSTDATMARPRPAKAGMGTRQRIAQAS